MPPTEREKREPKCFSYDQLHVTKMNKVVKYVYSAIKKYKKTFTKCEKDLQIQNIVFCEISVTQLLFFQFTHDKEIFQGGGHKI